MRVESGLRTRERAPILPPLRKRGEAKGIILGSRVVYVVDDDRSVRLMVSYMLSDAGLRSHPFAGGADFVAALDDLDPGCILLDLRMPVMGGLEVMAELVRRGVDWPVVFMTGHGDVAVAVEAMKLGAIDFLQKPFTAEALLSTFERGFALLDERRAPAARRRQARERIALLSGREAEVLNGLLAGLPNKLIAERLGISLRTVEMHRGNMMVRLGVENLAEALTLAMDAGLGPAQAKAG